MSDATPIPPEVAPPPPPPAPKPFGALAALLAFLTLLGAQIVGGVLAGLVVGTQYAIQGKDLSDPATKAEFERTIMPLAILLAMVAACVAVPLITRVLLGGPLLVRGRAKFGLVGASRAQWLVGLGLGVVLAGALLVTALLVPPAEDAEGGPLSQMAESGGFPFAVWLIVAVLLAPPLEEFLFRGVMLHGFQQRWGVWNAATIVTLLFTLMHVTEAIHYPIAFVFIGLLGLLTVIVRIRSGSVLPAFATHLGYNGTIALILVASKL